MSTLLLRLLMLPLAVALRYSIASAQSDDIILNDISFPCNNCHLLSDGICEIEINKVAELLPCEAAFDKLLRFAAQEAYYAKTLSPIELRNALLSNKLSATQVYNTFISLLQTPEGQQLIRETSHELLSRHPQTIYTLSNQNTFDELTLRSFWNTSFIKSTKLLALRTNIATKLSDLKLDSLLQSIAATNVLSVLNDISIVRQALLDTNSPWVSSITKALPALKHCVLLKTQGTGDTNLCTKEHLATLPLDISRFLLQVHTSLILNIISTQSTPVDKLNWMHKLDYERFRTPTSHDIMLELIDHAIANMSFSEVILDGSHSDLITVFLDNDEQIAERLSVLYLQLAKAAIEESNKTRAALLVSKAFTIYSKPLASRDKIFLTIYDALSDDTEVLAIVKDALGEKLFTKLIATPIGIKLLKVAGLLALLLLIVVGIDYFIQKRRTRSKLLQRHSSQKAALSSVELRQILHEFSLPHNATLKDLKSAYRAQAMKTHPDTGDGNLNEFTTLRNKFNRANYLLANSKRNSG